MKGAKPKKFYRRWAEKTACYDFDYVVDGLTVKGFRTMDFQLR